MDIFNFRILKPIEISSDYDSSVFICTFSWLDHITCVNRLLIVSLVFFISHNKSLFVSTWKLDKNTSKTGFVVLKIGFVLKPCEGRKPIQIVLFWAGIFSDDSYSSQRPLLKTMHFGSFTAPYPKKNHFTNSQH